MKTGQIIVGVRSTLDGPIRRLTITEQLRVCLLSPIGADIIHPVHGKIAVSRETARILLTQEEGHLYRFKRELFI